MLKRLIPLASILGLLCLPVFSAVAQTVNWPEDTTGTWHIVFGQTQPGSPIPSGESATLVLTAEGALCIADLLLVQPQLDAEGAQWQIPEMGLTLRISDLTGFGQTGQVTLSSTAGVVHGQFQASYVSDSTACGPLGSTPGQTASLYELTVLAEQLYPQYFPGSASPSSFLMLDGFIYRFYSQTGVYLGFSNGLVYLLGGEFGGEPQLIGSVPEVLALLRHPPDSQDCPALVFCPQALVDPGLNPWQPVPQSDVSVDCRLDDSLLRSIPVASGASFAVVRYGKLCFVSGPNGSDGPQVGAAWSATKTLGAILTGMVMYESKNVPEAGAGNPRSGPLREFDRMDKWIDLAALPPEASINPDATIAHVLAMVGYNADLSHGAKRHSYDVTGSREINALLRVLDSVSQQAGVPGSSAVDAKNRLFDRLGMQHSVWGANLFGYGWYASLMDMARVGLLVLNGGIYNGERLLDAQYVYNMTHPAFEDGSVNYGYLTWLSPATCAPRAVHRSYPHGLSEAGSCGLPGGCDQTYDVGVWNASGLGGPYILGHRGLDLLVIGRNWSAGSNNLWLNVLPAIVAEDPVYRNDETAFCSAYSAGDHAPDLRLWEGGL